MRQANIHDRGSIERIYSRAVYARDANANMRAKASVLFGVRIASGPDGNGAFVLTRASRHAGEADNAGGAVFLAPFAQDTAHSADYPVSANAPDEGPGRSPYDEFLDRILATARTLPSEPTPGRGEAGLQGPRQ